MLLFMAQLLIDLMAACARIMICSSVVEFRCRCRLRTEKEEREAPQYQIYIKEMRGVFDSGQRMGSKYHDTSSN